MGKIGEARVDGFDRVPDAVLAGFRNDGRFDMKFFALQVNGANVLTIEGLASGDKLHPMQEAFRENHGLQCGFCTPGMIMAAVDLVNRKGHALEERTIREELEGNICRCTGYHNIVKSIAAGARAMGGGSASQAAE